MPAARRGGFGEFGYITGDQTVFQCFAERTRIIPWQYCAVRAESPDSVSLRMNSLRSTCVSFVRSVRGIVPISGSMYFAIIHS